MKISKYFFAALLLISTGAFAAQSSTYIRPLVTFTNGYGKPLIFRVLFRTKEDTLPNLPSTQFTLKPGQSITTQVIALPNALNVSNGDNPNADVRIDANSIDTDGIGVHDQNAFAFMGVGTQQNTPYHAIVSGRLSHGISYQWHSDKTHIHVLLCGPYYVCKLSK